MIGIIDYGLGNIRAISNIYDKLKIKNIIINIMINSKDKLMSKSYTQNITDFCLGLPTCE